MGKAPTLCPMRVESEVNKRSECLLLDVLNCFICHFQGAKDAKSWLEQQEAIRVMQEAAVWEKEKAQLLEQFRSIQKEVSTCFVTLPS